MKKLIPEDLKRFLRVMMASFFSLMYGNPASKLKIIGVTGTSGKSTTTNMIYHVLKESGLKVGVVSTLGSRAGDKIIDTGLHVTTPDAKDLQKILKQMVESDIEYVVLEVSSHALAQGRVHGVNFEMAVYTNIKRDHLDWHGNWENYAKAKAMMLAKLNKGGVGIINRDDDDSYIFLNQYAKDLGIKDSLIGYSLSEIRELMFTTDGISFVMDDVEFSVPIIGSYNIENILATVSCCLSIEGIELENISEAFSTFQGVKGRMEVMQRNPFWAIVDFAHNTDSLKKSLKTAKDLVADGSKLMTVFGSAGLRDVEKRFTMGEAATEFVDIIIVTAEDPRVESLFEINSEIARGAESKGFKVVRRFATSEEYNEAKKSDFKDFDITSKSIFIFDEESVNSRYDAIDFAIQIAKSGDVVITEGKGHELSLSFGKTEYPFTDQAAVERALKSKK